MFNEKLRPIENEGIQICSISLHWGDQIRFIGVPIGVITSMRAAITVSWGQIQKESDYHGTYEFQLKGNPWSVDLENPVRCRRLLIAILTTMAHSGWNLVQSADISKKGEDKQILYFEKGTPDHDANLFAMSFSSGDTLHIIDAPSFAPYSAKHAIHSQWQKGIQKEKESNGSTEFKLAGNPWHPDGAEAVAGSRVIGQLIANFRAKGYKVYGCFDITVGNNKMADLSSWVFRRVGNAWQ